MRQSAFLLAVYLGAWVVLAPVAAAEEVKGVEVAVKNSSDQDVYVAIDKAGRIGKGKTPDSVKGPDGKALPPGLIIKAKSQKSFGEAIGLGDAPTLHLWVVKGDKAVEKEKASTKVGPLAKGTLETLPKGVVRPTPKFTLEWTGTEFKPIE